MTDRIHFRCAPAAGAEIEQADVLCAEVRAAMAAARPDLEFVDGAEGAPAAEVTLTRGNARGLGLTVAWIDAGGARTTGAPMETTFFDAGPAASRRQGFYAAFLNANPIPF